MSQGYEEGNFPVSDQGFVAFGQCINHAYYKWDGCVKGESLLIYAFLTRMEFDLGMIMLDHMDRVRPFGARWLFYPSMITRMLRRHHVDEEYHHDRVIPVPQPTKVFDVISMIDPPGSAATMDQKMVLVEETLQMIFADIHIRTERGVVNLAQL